MASLKDALKKAGSGAAKVVSAPQRKLAQALAERVGAKANPDDSEESFRNAAQSVAEKVAPKLGIDPNSTAANVVKALGVGAAELALDPLGPLGKAAKVAKVAEGVKKLGKAGLRLVKGADAAKDAAKISSSVSEASPFLIKKIGKNTAETESRVVPWISGDKPLKAHTRPQNMSIDQKKAFVEQLRRLRADERRGK